MMKFIIKIILLICITLLSLDIVNSQESVYSRMQKVAAGEYQIHYIKSDSTLWASGHLSPGYLATGNVVRKGRAVPVKQVNGMDMPKFVKAYGGLHQNAAVDINGNVWTLGEAKTWGCDACIAGDGGKGYYDFANKIEIDEKGNPFTGISMLSMFAGAGGHGWYAVKEVDSSLWWWGIDEGMGYALDGLESVTIQNRPKQVPVPGNKKVVQVVSGGFVIVLCSDGTVYTGAGGCDDYQVPKGYPCNGKSFTRLNQVNGLSKVTSIAGGHQIAYAICGTDSVMAWGRENLLGLGKNEVSLYITPKKMNWNLPSSIRMIVTNTSSTHAILMDSTLWGWGHSAQGEVGNGTMLDRNIYNFIDGISRDTIINQPVRIVPSRKDFVNIYGAMPYTFFSYFEAENGQLYFCGRNKAGIAGNGEVEPPGNNMAANYAQTWSKEYAVPIDIFSLRSSILVPAQQCVDNGNATGCNNYIQPANYPPKVFAGPDQNIDSENTIIVAKANPHSGRKIASYVWSQLSGPTYAHFNTFNDSIAQVSRLKVGEYKFVITVKDSLNSTGLDTIAIVVKPISTNSGRFFLEDQINLFPNPCYDDFYVESNYSFTSYQIFDSSGNKILEKSYSKKIDVKGLNHGIYLLILFTDAGYSKKIKFVIAKS